MSKKYPIEVCCVCCEEMGTHDSRGLRMECYMRHRRAGTLDEYPLLGTSRSKLARMEDFVLLRTRGVSVRQAAIDLGVHPRTGTRYSTALKTLNERQPV